MTKTCQSCGKEMIRSRTPLKTQSVRFDKEKYTVKQAKKWLKSKGFKYGKVDSSGNYHKFRQIDPKGFDIFRTKEISYGIQMVFAGKK